MRSGRAQLALVAHDAEHAVRDAVTQDCIAAAGLGVDGSVGPAQPTTAEDLARVLGLYGLVRFAGLVRPRTFYRLWREFSGFAQGDGLVTPPDFVSVIGTLFPIAPCGRSSL